MKKLLIALLLLPSLAWGQEYARMNPYILGAGVAAAAPSTFCSSATATPGTTGIFCEDFEGAVECASTYSSNCRAAWTVAAGTPDFDYGTAIDGTYSLNAPAYTNAAAIVVRRGWTESTGATYYGYFKMKVVNAPTGTTYKKVVEIRTNNMGSSAGLVNLEYATTVKVSVQASGGTKVVSVGSVTEGSTYNVWWKYIPGSGANAEFHVAFAETTTKPTDGQDGYVKSTDGTGTLAADGFEADVEYNSGTQCNDIVIDNIFVDDADLAGVPS